MKYIITENKLNNTLIHTMNTIGVVDTAKLVGGYDELSNLIDVFTIPDEIKIKDIKKVLKELGGVSLFEIDEAPIPYKETARTYHQIVYLGEEKVVVEVSSGYNLQDTSQDYYVVYDKLSESILNEILEIIIKLDSVNNY